MRTFVPQVEVLPFGQPANVLSLKARQVMDGCNYLSKAIETDDLLAKLNALIRSVV